MTERQEIVSKSASKREKNLSRQEKTALVMGIAKRKKAIFGDINSPDFSERANSAWEAVCAEVNALNEGALRNVKWLRERFSKWKSDVKKAMAMNVRERRVTGGGEGRFHGLTDLDRMVADLIAPEEVLGIKGAQEFGFGDEEKFLESFDVSESVEILRQSPDVEMGELCSQRKSSLSRATEDCIATSLNSSRFATVSEQSPKLSSSNLSESKKRPDYTFTTGKVQQFGKQNEFSKGGLQGEAQEVCTTPLL